jgi:hypothetical protein
VNFKDNSFSATNSSLLLQRYNDLRNKMCINVELNAHKKNIVEGDEIGTHCFTIHTGLQLIKKLSDIKGNYFFAVSSSNIYAKTFDGVDVSGRRLAKEVCTKEVCSRDCSMLFFMYELLG